MLKITQLTSHPLKWVQPSMKMEYELLTGETLAATLKFRSMWGTLAFVNSGDGDWTFKRIGFWQPRATVRVEGRTDDLAVFEHHTWSGGGTLTLAGWRPVRVTTNVWHSKIEFLSADDDVLFRYLTEGFLRQESQVEVMPSLGRMPERLWLLLFGWYLVVMMHEDTAATAVIIG